MGCGLHAHMLVCVCVCVCVCVGLALIMIVSACGFADVPGNDHIVLDLSRVAAQVVSGIGLLGAGSILLPGEIIEGPTTAASLWSVAAVGLAVGGGLYPASIAAAIVVLIILGRDRTNREALHRSQAAAPVDAAGRARRDDVPFAARSARFGEPTRQAVRDAAERRRSADACGDDHAASRVVAGIQGNLRAVARAAGREGVSGQLGARVKKPASFLCPCLRETMPALEKYRWQW